MKVYVNQQFSYKQHALNSDANYLMMTKEVYLEPSQTSRIELFCKNR